MNTLIRITVIIMLALSPILLTNAQSNKKVSAFSKSIAEEKNGNYTKAISDMNQLYEEYKNDYLVNLRLGWLYYMNKQYDKSERFYKAALSISSNSIEAMLGLTYPYSAQDKWNEIKDLYKKILTKDSFNYTANLRLGQIYLNSKDFLNARKYLEKNFKEYPSDYDTNLSLGYVYLNLGDKTHASECFINALSVSPGDTTATEALGKL